MKISFCRILVNERWYSQIGRAEYRLRQMKYEQILLLQKKGMTVQTIVLSKKNSRSELQVD
jgi:hypothetical protein